MLGLVLIGPPDVSGRSYRVPLLGRIPVVGMLFRGRRSEVQKTHLLIFVSPTVVDLREMTPAAFNALDFWKNGSWTNEQAIADEMQLMQTER